MRSARTKLWSCGLMTAVLFFLLTSSAGAMPALDQPFTLVQPNGTKLVARQGGDEWRNWVSNEGRLIVQDADGWWRYGRIVDHRLESTSARAGLDAVPSGTATTEDVSRLSRQMPDMPKEAMWAPAGDHKAPEYALIILVQFADRSFTYTSEGNWCNWYFSSAGNTARTYFDEVSKNAFKPIMAADTWNINGDGVVKVTLGYNHPNPGATIGDANRLIVYDALVAANPYVNFATYDSNSDGYISSRELHILTIVAGYERGYAAGYSPSVWGHRWALGFGAVSAPYLDNKYICHYVYGGYMQGGEIHADHMATVGVSCHEMGHDIGLIDLYDTDATSAGIGGHGLMGYGGWGQASGDAHRGQTPTHPCAWSKILAGLATPDTVSGNGFQTLYATDSLAYNALKILTSDADEYFLIENRQMSGFDAGLWAWFDTTSGGSDAGGLAVWHIDESISNNDNEAHKKVDLEEANQGAVGHSELDNLDNLGNRHHYFYLEYAPHFGDGTVPNSRLYNGNSTNLDVAAVSSAGEAMTAFIMVQPMGLLDWSTYLGHSEEDWAMGVAVDDSGYAFVTGFTYSDNFPTTQGAYQNYNYTYCSVFVTKFNKDGSSLVYSTFLNGGSSDFGFGIAVDDSGYAYITGYTYSTAFPTTVGAYDRTHNGNSDVFITKLNKTGSNLVYSTFLGGGSPGPDQGYAIAIDGSRCAYVTGYTYNTDFPVTVGAYDMTHNGEWDAFATKLNTSGSALSYSTFLGGSELESGRDIAVDGSNYAYVIGWTESSDFPTTAGAYDRTLGGYEDAFVTKVATNGASLSYSTFLGGSNGAERGYGIAVDNSYKAYVTGYTGSSNFPTTSGAYDQSLAGTTDAFATKFNAAGSSLEFSTYLGGSTRDFGRGIALDGSGGVCLAGITESIDFPVTGNAVDATFNGIWDIFQTQVNAAGTGLIFSTYLGGSGSEGSSDWPAELARDDQGGVYIVTYTDSADYPATAGAWDVSFNGGSKDAVVSKIGMGMVDMVPPFAVDDLTTALTTGSKTSGNMYLEWSEPYDNFGVTGYVVYRDTLTGSLGDSIAVTTDTTYLDSGAAGDTLTNYFYRVKAYDAAGYRSAQSNQAGEFDRRMLNGMK